MSREVVASEASDSRGHRNAERARTGGGTRAVVLDEVARDVEGTCADARSAACEGYARIAMASRACASVKIKTSGTRHLPRCNALLPFPSRENSETRTDRGSPMSAYESEPESESDAEASSPGRDHLHGQSPDSSVANQTSRAARGLAFLRRDLARCVASAERLDCIRPDAGGASKPKSRRTGVHVKTKTQLNTGATPSLTSKSATARLAKPSTSYGARLESGLRNTKKRISSLRKVKVQEKQRRFLHDDTGLKLPTLMDHEQASRVKLHDKLKTANECSRRLNIKTRYRAVTRDRLIYVEAFPVEKKEKENDDETSKREKNLNSSSQPPPPRRLLSVTTFLNSEQRLWAQAHYLETDARRAAHTSKRTMRPVTEIEKALALDEDEF